jgi:hypothetical protein
MVERPTYALPNRIVRTGIPFEIMTRIFSQCTNLPNWEVNLNLLAWQNFRPWRLVKLTIGAHTHALTDRMVIIEISVETTTQLKICLLHTLEKVFCKDQKQDMCELLLRNPLAPDLRCSSFYLLATLMALPLSEK